jgi:hypothetical protein
MLPKTFSKPSQCRNAIHEPNLMRFVSARCKKANQKNQKTIQKTPAECLINRTFVQEVIPFSFFSLSPSTEATTAFLALPFAAVMAAFALGTS